MREDVTPELKNPWGRPETLDEHTGDKESKRIARVVLREIWDRHIYDAQSIGAPSTVDRIAVVLEPELRRVCGKNDSNGRPHGKPAR